ncbi:MAG: aminotransferase class III-fold pyridoxal phosphate-dependent enzyme [Myxococcota bacterium]|nr:aminotransferase class III-fold pyridoxal phosphate-dependent enzyme [Myxococcota bacterium]
MSDGSDRGRVDGPAGQELWRRADAVLPGGAVYLSRSARFAGDDVQPGFIAEASGCRVTDVDGRRYIDFLCANGPILLGYRHPEVEEAVRRQAERADSASFFPPALVDLADLLVEKTPGMAWAVPAKNGSDVIGLAGRVARVATGRETLVVFDRAYHGFDPEFALSPAGVPAASVSKLVRVPWNDLDAFDRAMSSCQDDLAGFVLNPLDQFPLRDTAPPSPGLLDAISAMRERTGAVLVIDDVRAGLRLAEGPSHRALGIEPDLVCLGKSLGNGHPVSALLGTEALRAAARQINFTATYFFTAAALRGAERTLQVYHRDGAFHALWRAGERLREGLLAAAAKSGHRIRYTGPPSMPTLLFEDDAKLERGRRFSREAALRGAIFHPTLNWFLSAAHDDAAIDEAIGIAEAAFDATPVE